MGPNGSGKSTLAQVLAGRDSYTVTEGEVLYDGRNLLEMKPEERAGAGLFLAFQYPVEIPGVSSSYFLKTALNAIRKYRGQGELDAMDGARALNDVMDAHVTGTVRGLLGLHLDAKMSPSDDADEVVVDRAANVARAWRAF